MLSKEEINLLVNHPIYKQYSLLLKLNMPSSLQSVAEKWLSAIPKLILDSGLELKQENKWRDASLIRPALSSPEDYSYFLISEQVLVKTRHGEVMCAYYKEDEDKNEKWISACSEGWDITKSVTHWKLIDMD